MVAALREPPAQGSAGLHGKKAAVTIKPDRDNARVRMFPPAAPLLNVLGGIGLQWLWPIDLGFLIPAPARYWIGGLIAAGAFFGLGLWSVVLMRHSGQNVNPWTPTFRILDRGPFAVTRNPMYLQMVLICLGIAVMLANPWLLLLTPVCAWALDRLAIQPEEAYLEAKFGDAYRAYKTRVRRWL